MATLTAARALSTFPVAKPIGGGVAATYFGTYALAANPAAADILQMTRVPAGFIATGGFVYGADLDAHATETLDFDVGWADNGIDAADPDGFGNFGSTLR